MEIKNKKGINNLIVDYFSVLELVEDRELKTLPINDYFPDE